MHKISILGTSFQIEVNMECKLSGWKRLYLYLLIIYPYLPSQLMWQKGLRDYRGTSCGCVGGAFYNFWWDGYGLYACFSEAWILGS